MKIFLLLAFCLIIEGRTVKKYKKCKGPVIRSIQHEEEILKEINNSPYQLAIDYDTNTLFFSYTSPHAPDFFKSAYLNLKTNEYNTIPGITGGFANAVDYKSHTVYLGGADGIYQFDFDKKTALNLYITNLNIWQLFYKDHLYFTIYNNTDEKLYVYKDGKIDLVPELTSSRIMLAGIDNNNNIYFSNSTGLYYYTRQNGEISHVGNYVVNAIIADIEGNIYFSTPTTINAVNGDQVENLVKLKQVFGFAIESDDNIIYATETAIIRLKPTKTKCDIEVYDKNVNEMYSSNNFVTV